MPFVTKYAGKCDAAFPASNPSVECRVSSAFLPYGTQQGTLSFHLCLFAPTWVSSNYLQVPTSHEPFNHRRYRHPCSLFTSVNLAQHSVGRSVIQAQGLGWLHMSPTATPLMASWLLGLGLGTRNSTASASFPTMPTKYPYEVQTGHTATSLECPTINRHTYPTARR
ncbi:hypothetical protein GQ607_000703 [Colletotrichum asianum]|uniref:Uncharacterized protein n=1 Tax=Colletotrichum asianum TaxID=702518 RepID=A0A8H3WW20_9PEZI|nr:hypothetical protein GQ607_000703 [Colletotrichum asianum]